MSTPAPMKLAYRDLDALSETFTNSLRLVAFDGQNMHFEFCIVRQDEPKPPNPPTGYQVPVSRLVMPLPVAIDLMNKVKTILDQLTKAGIIKVATAASDSTAGGQNKPH